MKKIDKLIITSFLGPFVLTFLVVVFILLNIHMLKYFDDIIGKDLGWDVIGTLLFYFAIFNTPVALPLAVLLSSLIAFGNLGEHFELTAVKSLGISLTRALVPIFVFVLFVTGFAFYTGNYLVPKAALEAYSLLYDIKQKKPALDLKEGEFTSSIPDINIKVNDRLPDGKTIRDVIIYDHRGVSGNKKVIVADSGRMYTILNDQYLKLELFRGYSYSEGSNDQDIAGRPGTTENISKTKFDQTNLVFDLSSFSLMRTDKKWFQGNRIMRNMEELDFDMDSMRIATDKQKLSVYQARESFFFYQYRPDSIPLPTKLQRLNDERDSLLAVKNLTTVAATYKPVMLKKPLITERIKTYSDSLYQKDFNQASEISSALLTARNVSNQLRNINAHLENYDEEFKVFQIQWHKILALSIACLAMFFIGAPLGAIIKKGGLGMPVLASILFFIVFYVLNLLGEKWGKQGIMPVPIAMWMANFILFAFGMVFLRQARLDARLFEADFYHVIADRVKQWLISKKVLKTASS
jgi:lipopolysaccharide export system permease protein